MGMIIYMKEFFEQYRRAGEEYQSPGYAFKNDGKIYHMGIYVKNGEGVGYALYADSPLAEEEKLNALKYIGGMLVSFTRVKRIFEKQVKVETSYMRGAKKAIRKWAVTEEEKKMAARYEEFFEVILTARQRFLKDCDKVSKLQQKMFDQGYFEIADKEYLDSLLLDIDATLYILIKRQHDDFEKNKELLRYIEDNRNRLGFFKYRLLKSNLSISTLEKVYENILDSLSTFDSKYSHLPAVLENIEHEGLRSNFISTLIKRDMEIMRQTREKLRN